MPFVPAATRQYITEASGFAKVLASITYVENRVHPTLSLELRDVNVITSPDYGLELRGARANVAWQNLNPPRAQPGQVIHIEQLKVSQDITLQQVHVEFGIGQPGEVKEQEAATTSLPSSILLSAFRFNWAGGEVSAAEPVVINPREMSGAIDLQIRHVGLNEFLQLVSGGRASGVGAISGDLPIQVDWLRITIGTGRIASDGPGDINFGQQVHDLAQTVAERDPRLRGQEQQLVAALKHFHYDLIVFEFERMPDGLQVM